MSKAPLGKLSDLGQSVWIDSLSRDMIESGELQRLIDEDSVVGVTTNPSIFQKALSSVDAYDEQMREVMDGQQEDREVFFELAATDVRNACDVLRPVWDSGGGRDCWVSLEVDPYVAHDADQTLEDAKRLSKMVDRPFCFI